MSWPSGSGFRPARRRVGRLMLVSGAVTGSATLAVLLVGLPRPDPSQADAAKAGVASLAVGRPARPVGVDTPASGDDRGDPGSIWVSGWAAGDGAGVGVWTSDPDAGASRRTDRHQVDPAGRGHPVEPDDQTTPRPAPPDVRAGSANHRLVCTIQLADLAELPAAQAHAGPGQIICLRAPGIGPVPVAAVAFARAQLGQPYRWGGRGRADGGFDCSGLTSAAFAAAGMPIPRTAQAQFNAGPRVPAGQPIRAGDLVFFGGGPHSVRHVGLAISPTQMINAPDEGRVVSIEPIQRRDFVGATRPAGAASAPL